MDISTGSFSEDGESDVNITQSSENDDDDANQSANASTPFPPSKQNQAIQHKKQVSESETDYDEENGELDPLARMLSTPTQEDETNPPPEKMPRLDTEKKPDREFATPKASPAPKESTSGNQSDSSPSKEHEKEMERRAEARSKREAEEEEREKMQVLVSNFTEEQLDRYEMYRRSAFPKAAIKRVS